MMAMQLASIRHHGRRFIEHFKASGFGPTGVEAAKE
jgi:hypothetical protein